MGRPCVPLGFAKKQPKGFYYTCHHQRRPHQLPQNFTLAKVSPTRTDAGGDWGGGGFLLRPSTMSTNRTRGVSCTGLGGPISPGNLVRSVNLDTTRLPHRGTTSPGRRRVSKCTTILYTTCFIVIQGLSGLIARALIDPCQFPLADERREWRRVWRWISSPVVNVPRACSVACSVACDSILGRLELDECTLCLLGRSRRA